ncbi:ribose-5-phosphate isomerase RpiA [Flavihumibacter fluvii]|uniref:ribose-5-phosphate isomerase RpiA n=1 Tax=Flavihumibacter fluvii TaxID=2838157 RepID=UPI001BDE499E|nr:ribose-5-phosphate isomerase RpiA [Flavihumibacter fluvii]ULQ53522.1 ribose-5-phosphate isomerase RpiA [Flavihumibacter fluvii]
MLTPDQIKEKVGWAAAQLVKEGMTIGAGTGSTAFWFIQALGMRVKEGLQCRAVPTSAHTHELLTMQNIPVVQLNDVDKLDLVVDGADEIDEELQLIKGGGGALLREKMVAFAGIQYVIIADNSKLVQQLGSFPLPIEVIPYGFRQVQRCIENKYGIKVSLRVKTGQPFLTDNHNYILDISLNQIHDLKAVQAFLKSIPGVVEDGLFLDMAQEAIIGYPNGELRLLKNKSH